MGASASARNVLGPFKPKGEPGAGGSETLRSAQGRLLREAPGQAAEGGVTHPRRRGAVGGRSRSFAPRGGQDDACRALLQSVIYSSAWDPLLERELTSTSCSRSLHC